MSDATPDKNNRIFTRFPIKLVIEIQNRDGQTAMVTETEDLSQGGVSFYADWKIPENYVIELTFIHGHQNFRIKARVNYSMEDARTWRFFTGAVFVDQNETATVKLTDQFIEFLKAEPDKTDFKKIEPYEIEGTANAAKKPFWLRWLAR